MLLPITLTTLLPIFTTYLTPRYLLSTLLTSILFQKVAFITDTLGLILAKHKMPLAIALLTVLHIDAIRTSYN